MQAFCTCVTCVNTYCALQEGCTPLHYAAVAGFSKFSDYNEIVGLLLEHGSRPNEKPYLILFWSQLLFPPPIDEVDFCPHCLQDGNCRYSSKIVEVWRWSQPSLSSEIHVHFVVVFNHGFSFFLFLYRSRSLLCTMLCWVTLHALNPM